MADAVTSQTIQDSQTTAVLKFTNVSDGTGESAVKKVDVSALEANHRGEACTSVSCLLYTSPSPRDGLLSRMPSSA